MDLTSRDKSTVNQICPALCAEVLWPMPVWAWQDDDVISCGTQTGIDHGTIACEGKQVKAKEEYEYVVCK